MEENKKLARWEMGMLVLDTSIVLWDTGLATYQFIQGQWLNGVLLVAASALMMWSAIGLLKSKHELAKMQLHHERMMMILRRMRSLEEVENEG